MKTSKLKAIMLASAAAIALGAVSAPAFAGDCGPLWVDGNGNRTTAPNGHPNPANKDGCELTVDNWNNDIGPNINKAMADNQSQVWNGVKYKASVNGADHQVWSPGLGSVVDNDPHWGSWTNANGSMKTVSEKINDDSDRIDANTHAIGDNAKAIAGNKQQIDTNTDNITKLQTGGANDSVARVNAQKALDLMNGATGPGGGDDTVARQGVAKNSSDIAKISETDANGNMTAKDTTARQGVEDNKTAIATTQQSIGDDDFRQESVQGHLADMNTSISNTISQTSINDRAYTDSVAATTLNKANAYTDGRFNQLNGKIDKLRSRIDSGVAGATALASIPFSSLTKNSFGGSVAVANSKAAGAVGYQRNFDKHWSARGTVAFGDNYAQGGIGGSYSW